MIMDDILGFWGYLLLVVAILAICVGIYGMVWNSDLPMWLKLLLLR